MSVDTESGKISGDETWSEVRDGMMVEWHVPIKMDDGIELRADVFRPNDGGRYGAIITYGPYGKGLSFQEYFKHAWQQMTSTFPETAEGSSNKYQNWEVVDPEKWVPDGYVCIRVDSRGSGRSPGVIDPHSVREAKDFHDCIEWAAAQPWSNGKVGINGISYFAVNQWRVAGMKPPHLAAMCVWEGYADRYRDAARHGGILCTFPRELQGKQVFRVQYGVGERGPHSVVTGELVSGPETLSEEELVRNRAPIWSELTTRLIDDDYYHERSAHYDDIDVPFLSAGNWGGHGLHLRGNVESFVRSSSTQKWLEIHGQAHWTHFYTDYGINLQKRFLGHFLKGEDTGWDRQPPVQLQIRHPGEQFVVRHENEWPIARTQWTRFYPDPKDGGLTRNLPGEDMPLSFEAMGDGVTFTMPPLEEAMEITGPVAAKLFISSTTADADLFLVLRLFAPDGKEVFFHGTNDPNTPIGLGWLRASHRKLNQELSTPYRPYHSHDERRMLAPDEVVELDVEIWPTCIAIPAGYRLALTIRGKDFEHGLPPVIQAGSNSEMRGVGPFKHEDPADRPPEVFAGTTTLHFDKGREPYLLLPVIPAQ